MDNKVLTLKKLFNYEVETEKRKLKRQDIDVFTVEEISRLPEPVQKYFIYCQYIGKEKMTSIKIVFDDVHFKMGIGKPWINIKYQQYNFVPEPARIAYIYSRMFGIIPFEGRDKYQDGQGNMIGRLLKKKTIFDVMGFEINTSAAVTFLSESLMVPSCALQEYIRWEPIDSNNCKAAIEYKGIRAEGVFTFNEKGEFIRFQTDDRYMYMDNGTSEKHRWSAVAADYAERNGVKVPSRIKGVWNLGEGDHEYFDGRLVDVVYKL
jgi:hypothetical protein